MQRLCLRNSKRPVRLEGLSCRKWHKISLEIGYGLLHHSGLAFWSQIKIAFSSAALLSIVLVFTTDARCVVCFLLRQKSSTPVCGGWREDNLSIRKSLWKLDSWGQGTKSNSSWVVWGSPGSGTITFCSCDSRGGDRSSLHIQSQSWQEKRRPPERSPNAAYVCVCVHVCVHTPTHLLSW